MSRKLEKAENLNQEYKKVVIQKVGNQKKQEI